MGPTPPPIRLGAGAVSWGIKRLAPEAKYLTLVHVFVAWCFRKCAVARRSSPILYRIDLECFVLHVLRLRCVLLAVRLTWFIALTAASFAPVCMQAGRIL